MQPFIRETGTVMPLNRADIDTDQIIPKQYLKSISREGFGETLFDDWRYLEPGEPGMDHKTRKINPDFVLNDIRYSNAVYLLTQENFGCGSSREHAPWAIIQYGIRGVIAPSFADIFFNNALKNGLLPIKLSQIQIENLFLLASQEKPLNLTIDLNRKTLNTDSGLEIHFELDDASRQALLLGLDEIGLTLKESDSIKNFETKRKAEMPWLFG